mmetsp:Transcript_1021/g.2440  ORF Transcript_1021/g.2440 Transcript_1021/m.2440 type:complete len:113 (+) Transcript_1021:120-458(+)|eukprot:CAMPEP_0177632612 /NCGR_PEP_ID=MMETSP0447-20121125/2395_1 /TAXON_ID=0 /ORGANISM="Stygamoeba regulata, Strain BSH-02190019" /LENGTH=112 /DNA_ID=CAMNT_0019134213 /DNA_START=100 /DNA_END=438 /DNA_ORIENTATION=+
MDDLYEELAFGNPCSKEGKDAELVCKSNAARAAGHTDTSKGLTQKDLDLLATWKKVDNFEPSWHLQGPNAEDAQDNEASMQRARKMLDEKTTEANKQESVAHEYEEPQAPVV